MKTFYDNLFETAPAIKPLFADVNMEQQRQALLNMLVVLRQSLRGLDDIVQDLEDLGARRVDYGAHAEHYPVVGEDSDRVDGRDCQRRLEAQYTAAWQEAYGVVQGVMPQGAAARAG